MEKSGRTVTGLNRRALLRMAAASGAAAVAGCTGDGGSDRSTTVPATEPDGSPTRTPTPTDTSTPTAEPAAFELVRIDAPDTVEVGTDVDYSFTVENVGGSTGTFDTTIEIRIDVTQSDWQSSNTIEREVPPGETATITTEDVTGSDILGLTPPYECTATYIHLISDFGEEFAIEAVPRQLSFGDAHTTPASIDLGVAGVDLQPTYTYDDAGTEREVAAPDGKQWAFATVRAENAGYEVNPAPTVDQFAVLEGDDSYPPVDVEKTEGRYEDGELASDAVSEGWVAFAVPDRLGVGDLAVRWQGPCPLGPAVAFWRPG